MLEPNDGWFRSPWWEERIGSAICTDDPIVCNLRITMAHYELSLALRKLLGQDTGANFHTWATWGSKKAGLTIHQQDTPGLPRFALMAGGSLGSAVGELAGLAGRMKRDGAHGMHGGHGGPGRPQLMPSALHRFVLCGAVLGSLSLYSLTKKLLDISTQQILGGNITVLDDIGHATARFIYAFSGHPDPNKARLAEFVGTLRTGSIRDGGQGLLKDAFTYYYSAWHEPDPNARAEFMLLANLSAILHEHMRLHSLSERVGCAFNAPHTWHILLNGNHLNTFAKCFPCHSDL